MADIISKGEIKMYKTYIENGMDEIEIKCDFDYEPYEAMTRHQPPSDEAVYITEINMVETGAEICLLPKAETEVEESLLDWIHDEQEYAAYGYMLD
jgi:hypothetical protein